MLPIFAGQVQVVAFEFEVNEADHADASAVIELRARDELNERRTPKVTTLIPVHSLATDTQQEGV